ncbi:flavin reductase family protein [Ancylobacter pratisalsi]|uniref:Flavin reductase family protein n=2 Tax=Ancylobacter pratisalsi TaxID=1745854 RepID=A0A6P1YRX6_9HYPH|nr:flavin reductase family protein [Ancylobacter pratisalsi]
MARTDAPNTARDALSEPAAGRATVHFDFAAMSGPERYRLLASAVVPRPIAWVVTCTPDGTVNAAPYSFFNIFGADRPVLALGILARPDIPKDTATNIQATGEFVVNLVPFDLAEAMNITCIDAPPDVDEVELAGLVTVPSHAVRPPRIAASPVGFECRVMHVLETGPGQLLVVGEILHAHFAQDVLTGPAEHPRIDVRALDLIARMHGPSAYLRSRDMFDLPRPIWGETRARHSPTEQKE